MLGACSLFKPEPVRIGAHPWPGYELLYLARHLDLFSEEEVRLIEVPSASASLRALATHSMEGAGLTLDEVLSARERGVDLTVVAILNVSLGADVLLAQSGLSSLSALRGRRVGVEQTAVGAIMLDAILEKAGLAPADIELAYVTIDQHEQVFSSGQVDALVTYEPVKSRLIKRDAQQLFSSSDIPGRIIDTLAVRADVIERNPQAVGALVKGHFSARDQWIAAPAQYAAFLSGRLDLTPEEVPLAFSEIDLPDLNANRMLMKGATPPLLDTVERLSKAMMRANLLRDTPDLGRLFTDQFLG